MADEDTRERLVRVARRLFAEKGFGSTSIQDILREADVHAGSLYHFFPSKQDLLLEVLRTYRDGIGPMLLEPAFGDEADPIERIFALLARYRASLVSTDCFYGCPIGSLALELHEPDPAVRELLVANFDAWTGAIEGCLADAGVPARERVALASFVLTVMEGGVMQARTQRAIAPFDYAVGRLRDYLQHLERRTR